MKIAAAVLFVILATALSAGQEEEATPLDIDKKITVGVATEVDAEYRADVAAALKAWSIHLENAVRSTTREQNFDRANEIERARQWTVLIAKGLAARDLPGGLIVPPAEPLGGALEEHEKTFADALEAASTTYRNGLEGIVEASAEFSDHLLAEAVDNGDLGRVNRILGWRKRQARIVDERLMPLTWTRIRFDRPGALHHFRLTKPLFWRIEKGELVGFERFESEHLTITHGTYYDRIAAVTVKARIIPPGDRELRIAVGPVSAILNWERAGESHFRFHEKLTVVKQDALVAGRNHEITIQQQTAEEVAVLIDGEPFARFEGRLFGTVTIYPYVSRIGVSELRIHGIPGAKRPVRPSHRLW